MKKIVVMTNCRLGDSLVMLPALRVLRREYPQASITIASDAAGPGFVAARDILANRGIVDDFLEMQNPTAFLPRLYERAKFVARLRNRHFDLGVVLFPPYPPLSMPMVRRFVQYLKLGGVKRVVAPNEIVEPHYLDDGQIEPYQHVVDGILSVLSTLVSGLPAPGHADVSLPPVMTPLPYDAAELPNDKLLLAVAPGAKCSSQIWPKERFAEVLKSLRETFPHLHPVYFSGENERELCNFLHGQVPGTCIIGRPLPFVESALRQCRMYLGNDTGLMHLAVAVGLRCVAVFSARNPRGMWYPYGSGHCVLRTENVPCEGCMLADCPKKSSCLISIEVNDVVNAVQNMLTGSESHTEKV